MTDKTAKVFDTEKELKSYLEAHKGADRSRHSVKPKGGKSAPGEDAPPPGKKGPPPLPTKGKGGPPPIPGKAKKPSVKPPPKPDEHDDHHDGHEDEGHENKPKVKGIDGWKKRFTGLSDSAQKFVASSSKAVQHFLSDDHFRSQALGEAKDALKRAPKALTKNLIDTAKHEVKEFKMAAAGVKKIISGGKMSKHEKAAFRAVATHLAIGGTAAAFAASGPLAGAAIFAKGLAKHIALKAVHNSLSKVHMLEELSHVAHGVSHFLEHMASTTPPPSNPATKVIDPENEMANLVLACVHKELDKLTDEDYQDVLNKLPSPEANQEKIASEVAARFLLNI